MEGADVRGEAQRVSRFAGTQRSSGGWDVHGLWILRQ